MGAASLDRILTAVKDSRCMTGLQRFLNVKQARKLQRLYFSLVSFDFFMDYEWRDLFSEAVSWCPQLIVVPYILAMEAIQFRRTRLFVRLKDQVAAVFAVNEKGDTLHISSLAVAPVYRRLGIAKFTLDYSEKLARRLGKGWLDLWVARSNLPAMRLYRSFGFTVTKERKRSLMMTKRVIS
jgi:ribosomal protein S18 acetylase RimI-like enzyme